jgi:general secretion pathway protein M
MNELRERLRAWWAGLAEREQRILGAGGAVLALVLVYLAVWEPLARARTEREAALAQARALAVLIETLAAEAQRGRPAGAAPVAGLNQSLLSVVDQSRKASAITKPPSRLQPDGDATVRVWLEDVPFDALVRWLNELQTRYGVRVDNADIERESSPGLVNARLTLMRG